MNYDEELYDERHRDPLFLVFGSDGGYAVADALNSLMMSQFVEVHPLRIAEHINLMCDAAAVLLDAGYPIRAYSLLEAVWKKTPAQDRSPLPGTDAFFRGSILSPELAYVLLDDFHNDVKIGVSRNPEKRLRTLASAGGRKLQLVALFEDGRQMERHLHKRFAKYRTTGEWFRHEGELAAWLTEMRRQNADLAP